MVTGAGRDATETMLGFVRALRAAGVPAGTGSAQAFLGALRDLDPADSESVYWAGRLTLCSARTDLPRYDACFALYFGGRAQRPARRGEPVTVSRPAQWPAEGGDDGAAPDLLGAAADTEVLRSRDIATLSAEERAEVARLLSLISLRRPHRRTRRTSPAHRGRLDLSRTVRATLRQGGEAFRLPRRRRVSRPRRVVLIIDVSGSMESYADPMLRLAHAVVRGHPGHTEVFSAGTRLTRLTRELAGREAAAALRAAGAAIPDWSGGTRLGAELKEFLDLHGQRGMARGALVVVASDGWERGDCTLLGAQMARLHRLAYRVVWVNPHKAQPGFEPITGGMRAAMPHVDDFVSGHSLGALEDLAAVIGGPVPRGRSAAPRRVPIEGGESRA